MEITVAVLKWIVVALTTVMTPLSIWLILTIIRGLFKQKEIICEPDKYNKFAVLICARNEETVIANLLSSIKKQDYKGTFRCYVVADNCTDNTAEVARASGATVFERFDDKHIGKGYALKYGINCLKKSGDDIDAICVFDADNLAAPSFLTEMNRALCAGAQVVMGYRDTKNTHDSWVSEVYALYWLTFMRFFYKVRYTMGISSLVGGTGFAFLLSALDKGEWNTQTITEDIEFSTQQILSGNVIISASNAVFYDEQPTSFTASVKQRTRWMCGGVQCFLLYGGKALKAIFKGYKPAYDILWNLTFFPMMGLTIPLNILTWILILMSPVFRPYAWIILGVNLIAGYALTCLFAVVVLKLEKRDTRKMGRAILLYPFFMFTNLLIALISTFNPHTEWVPIEHNSRRTIEDLARQISGLK